MAETTWNTGILYSSADAPELHEEFNALVGRVRSYREEYLGKVADLSPHELHTALERLEALQELLVKPQVYAQLLFSQDSGNDTHKALSQRAAEFGNLIGRELLFFDLEIMGATEERFGQWMADGGLGNYHHFLASVRKFSPHTLPEREEQLLRLKSLTGTEAFNRLFDELSASFVYRMEINGEEQELTGEELLGLLHHPDAAVREKAFSLFLDRYREHSTVFSAVFNNVTLDHSQELELRGYSSPIEPTNLGNELSMETVENLMRVSESNYPLAQEYFRIKARLLNLPKLKNCDIYAPIEETERKYPFEEAKQMVIQAYEGFNPAWMEIIEAFFSDGRIDVLPRPGKSGGAYCMGISPSLPPFVLLNYTGNLRDVSTLAHELGHGLHFVLAQRQTMLNYHAPLPLAETASVFSEMLLTRMLLEKEHDRKLKISLLCGKIEDIIATTFRQNVLTRFEQRMHGERNDGLLTATRLGEIWLEENGKLYGDAVEMIEPYRWGWSYISHFIHARFYCYSYTFAELLVLSLYSTYLREGQAFIPAYEQILTSGGSLSPADTVKPAGIDLSDPGFWQRGYDLLEELLTELKALL